MTVAFTYSKLEIENFRGITEFDFTFVPGEVHYLVGANNAGKSTILNSLALALRGGGFHAFVPEAFDFRLNANGRHCEKFKICIRFAPAGGDLPAVQGVGSPEHVHGIEVVGKSTKRGYEHSHYLLDEDGAHITFSRSTALSKGAKIEFAGHELGWRPVNARPDDIRDHMPTVWRLSAYNIHSSLYDWKTGPLKRLSQLLSERFLETPWEFEWEGKRRSMPKGIENAHRFFKDAIQSFPFWQNDLRPKLEEALGRYVGFHMQFALAPEMATIQDWLAQQLALAFAVQQGGPLTPLERMGDGWQSLVRLAAIDVMSQYPELMKEKVLLLMEEPETHLHPHLRRRLGRVLEDVANKGWTVVASTHSSEFISFVRPQQITRLRRSEGGFDFCTVACDQVEDAIKLQEKLERGHSTLELPFSQRVVLLEGKSDDAALRIALAKFGLDVDAISLGLIRGDGAPSLPALAKLSAMLGIPWFCLLDDDLSPDGIENPHTRRIQESLAKIKTDNDEIASMPGKLEGVLGLTKHGDTREIVQLLEPMTKDQIKSRYPGFAAICDAIASWCEPPLHSYAMKGGNLVDND